MMASYPLRFTPGSVHKLARWAVAPTPRYMVQGRWRAAIPTRSVSVCASPRRSAVPPPDLGTPPPDTPRFPSMSPVPSDLGVAEADVAHVASLLSGSRRLLVITGAGVSTESGIPDYRSPGRPEYTPMTHQSFMQDEARRQRYWARSFVGYRRLSGALPSRAHQVLARLESQGVVHHIVTQNVDGLHAQAGSQRVLELHGSIHHVECTACSHSMHREELQQRLRWLNSASWDGTSQDSQRLYRPDGDVDLNEQAYASFKVADCGVCGGILKPAVVFFGGSIDRDVVQRSVELVDECDAVLCIGTTLTVFSVYRLARAAHQAGKPIGVVNFGDTRLSSVALAPSSGSKHKAADPVTSVFHVQADAGAVLQQAAARIGFMDS